MQANLKSRRSIPEIETRRGADREGKLRPPIPKWLSIRGSPYHSSVARECRAETNQLQVEVLNATNKSAPTLARGLVSMHTGFDSNCVGLLRTDDGID